MYANIIIYVKESLNCALTQSYLRFVEITIRTFYFLHAMKGFNKNSLIL